MVRKKMTAADNPEVDAMVAELASRRGIARAAVAHVRFVQENLVDQQMVRRCMDLGLSQSETATRLSMSKREVNRLANAPDLPWAAAPESFADLRAAFLGCVWGARHASQ